ncbi:MAG: hypothetical protein ACRDXB_04340 [Actinomycetes bacterium]
MRKTSVLSAVAAFALAGTALFGGAAMAGGHDDVTNTGGAGGAGGGAATDCFLPVGVSVGAIIGQGGDVAQCNAAGGAGGAGGGANADY